MMTARWRRGREAQEARREIESLRRNFKTVCESRDRWMRMANDLDRQYRELVSRTYPAYPSEPFSGLWIMQ